MGEQLDALSDLGETPAAKRYAASTLVGTPAPDAVLLLLSIHPQHSERIFNGSKHYELRKALPAAPLKRVYLYATGNTWVVGCFDVSEVIKDGVASLWRRVGTAATTEERFFRYFANSDAGFAIGVKNVVRFPVPVSLERLRVDAPRITAPMSYLVLDRRNPALQILEGVRREIVKRAPPRISLRPIADGERGRYQELVIQHIGKNYEGIDSSFASRTLEVHDLGFDPDGFFTADKEVLTILNELDEPIGFTTLTYKLGRSIKTGPTILFLEYRGRGFARAARAAVEDVAWRLGARKLYCTAPESAADTVRYLFGSGMRVEAQLVRQYSQDHDELVFGKMLLADSPAERFVQPEYPQVPGKLVPAATLAEDELISSFQAMFSDTWAEVPADFPARIVGSFLVDVDVRDFAKKPKRMVCLASGASCVGQVALLPKRGGAVKGLLLRRTDHVPSLRELIAEATAICALADQRKLYFVHPVLDVVPVALMREMGFAAEGLLRAPYVAGQDVILLSKFL